MLDLLIKNLTIVTMDDENAVLTDACIAVRDGKIDYIGTELPQEEAARTIGAGGFYYLTPIIKRAYCQNQVRSQSCGCTASSCCRERGRGTYGGQTQQAC